MSNKFFEYFLSSYKNESMEIQKKAQALLIGCFILIVGCLFIIPTLFINGIDAKSISGLIIFIINVVILSIALNLLRKNHYTVATYIVSSLAGVVLLFLLYSTTSNVLDISKVVASFLVCLALTCLIAKNKYQAILYYIESLLCVFLYIFLKIQFESWKFDSVLIKEAINGFIYLTLGTIFTIMVISIFDQRIKISNIEAENNKKRYDEIGRLLDSSKDGIDIGKNLINSSVVTFEKINDIESNINEIIGNIKELDSEINITAQGNSDIIRSTEDVNLCMKDFSSVISESSAAIEEMTKSITNISDISSAKKNVIDQLVDTTNKGEQDMQNSVDIINSLVRKSENLLEVINVIVEVADKTNILAMNAAIEAAHAGNAGKGFAVVADEVRNLAETTNENIKIINTTLKENIEDIQNSSDVNKRTSEIFRNINNFVKDVENAIKEIISGLKELNSGTSDIISGVSNSLNMYDRVNTATKEVEQKIFDSNRRIDKIHAMSSNISKMITSIHNNFSEIIGEVNKIKDIGSENIAHIQNLDRKIDGLKVE